MQCAIFDIVIAVYFMFVSDMLSRSHPGTASVLKQVKRLRSEWLKSIFIFSKLMFKCCLHVVHMLFTYCSLIVHRLSQASPCTTSVLKRCLRIWWLKSKYLYSKLCKHVVHMTFTQYSHIIHLMFTGCF